MTTIGTFKANGNEFTGEIATLTIQAKNVRIILAKKTTDAGPSHRVYSGRAEIAAAWTKRSKDGRSYLSVLLDDPSMMAPFGGGLIGSEVHYLRPIIRDHAHLPMGKVRDDERALGPSGARRHAVGLGQ